MLFRSGNVSLQRIHPGKIQVSDPRTLQTHPGKIQESDLVIGHQQIHPGKIQESDLLVATVDSNYLCINLCPEKTKR